MDSGSYQLGDQSEANDIDTSNWECSMPQQYFFELKYGEEECKHNEIV